MRKKIDRQRLNQFLHALSKIERFHKRDIQDVKEMLDLKLIEPERLTELFEAVEPSLYRFPAINPETFRQNLNTILIEK